jgi:hypothetical protein
VTLDDLLGNQELLPEDLLALESSTSASVESALSTVDWHLAR